MSQAQKSLSGNFIPFLRQILWHELGMTSLVVMELTWILPWFRSITPNIQAKTGTASFFVLLVFFLVISYTNRILRIFKLRPWYHRLVMIAILLIGIFSISNILVYPGLSLGFGEILYQIYISVQNSLNIIPEGFIVILMTLFIWWRGIVVSIGTLEIRTTERKFRLGILSLGVFAIIFRGEQIIYLLHVLPIYFAAGLLAVTFSRTRSLGRGITAYRLPYTGSWFMGMFLLTGLTIWVGLIVGRLLQSEPAYRFYEFFSTIFNRLLTYLEIILLPVIEFLFYVVEKVIEFLSRYIDPESFKGFMDQFQEQPATEMPFEQGESAFQLPPEAIAAIILLLLAGLVILFVRRANREQRYGIPEITDEGETVYRSRTFRSRVEKFLDQVLDGFETIRKFGIGRRMIAATVIRRIYSHMLELAADLGQPRDLAETPYEFQRKLVQIFPNQVERIGLITNAYVQVRYGEIPEEDQIIAQVEEAWSSIEKEARSVWRNMRENDKYGIGRE
jgi:hypothetical protein